MRTMYRKSASRNGAGYREGNNGNRRWNDRSGSFGPSLAEVDGGNLSGDVSDYAERLYRGGLQIYVNEISKVPLLTRDEEHDLAAKVKKGNEKARTHMIKANLRLVVRIAHDYEGLGLSLMDLISEGNIGLMKAVEKYDSGKGAKVSTYASWWIKQSMRRALANQSRTIRLPVHIIDQVSEMRRAYNQLTEEIGREPTDYEVGMKLGVPEERVTHLRTISIRPGSLNAHVDNGEGGTSEFGEIIEDQGMPRPDVLASSKERYGPLRDILSGKNGYDGLLNDREAEIIRLRFGLNGDKPKTLEQVGRRFKVTR